MAAQNRSTKGVETEESALEKIAEWWHKELRKMCENRECEECPYRELCPKNDAKK